MLKMAPAVKDADQDHIHQNRDRQRHDKHLPHNKPGQPERHKGGQGQGPDADDGDGDDAPGAVGDLLGLRLLSGDRLPLVMRGEQVVHRDAEDLPHLLQDKGIRDRFGALPLGDRLIRVVEKAAEFGLGHARPGAEVDDVACGNQLEFFQLHETISLFLKCGAAAGLLLDEQNPEGLRSAVG